MRKTAVTYGLWFLQLASLIVILYSASLMLDRPGFALVCACIVLASSLYIEHSTLDREP